MFGSIVLRNIPKENVRIDLLQFAIEGGFRGFSHVPAGLHYISIQVSQHHIGFWTWVDPGQAVVKTFNVSQGFVTDTSDMATNYAQISLSGAMGPALVSCPTEKFNTWFGLVSHIRKENFPVILHNEDLGDDTRFERAFLGTHKGNSAAFLAEFQYSFACWLVSLDTRTEDNVALARWQHLLLAAYNAGEDRIRESGALFPDLVDTILKQFALLPDKWFKEDSFLIKQVEFMIEDMQDTSTLEIANKGQELSDYIKTRQK